MRPPHLNPLFATVRTLKGVGPKVEGLLTKLVAPSHENAHARVIDLLWHLPTGLIDRAMTPSIAAAKVGEIATLEVTVAEHRQGGGRRGGRSPYKVLVEDDSGGAFDLVYFNAEPNYLKRLLPVGSRRLVSGRLVSYDGWLQMPHPDHVVAAEGTGNLPLIEPVYPLTTGLSNSVLRKSIGEALPQVPKMPEWIDADFRRQEPMASIHRGDNPAA
jgi:ATP-dependent DNA helicase RecG